MSDIKKTGLNKKCSDIKSRLNKKYSDIKSRLDEVELQHLGRRNLSGNAKLNESTGRMLKQQVKITRGLEEIYDIFLQYFF